VAEDKEIILNHPHIHTYIHTFNGPLSGTTRVSRYQKGKTNLDFTEARDSEWQWHQLGYTQVCISLQTDNHTSTPRLKFFTGRMPFLPPNQQRESTEGTTGISYRNTIRSNFSHCSLSFFLHDWLHDFPDFYCYFWAYPFILFSFSVLHFLVVGSVR